MCVCAAQQQPVLKTGAGLGDGFEGQTQQKEHNDSVFVCALSGKVLKPTIKVRVLSARLGKQKQGHGLTEQLDLVATAQPQTLNGAPKLGFSEDLKQNRQATNQAGTPKFVQESLDFPSKGCNLRQATTFGGSKKGNLVEIWS